MIVVRSSHRIIAATLAALGSAGVLAACDRRDKPTTEVPGAAPAAAAVRVPDGIEPLTAAQEAERDLATPSDEELHLLLESSEEYPVLEGACGAEASCASALDANCGACGSVADSGS